MFGRPRRRPYLRYHDQLMTVLAVMVAAAMFLAVYMWAVAQARS